MKSKSVKKQMLSFSIPGFGRLGKMISPDCVDLVCRQVENPVWFVGRPLNGWVWYALLKGK